MTKRGQEEHPRRLRQRGAPTRGAFRIKSSIVMMRMVRCCIDGLPLIIVKKCKISENVHLIKTQRAFLLKLQY